MPVIIKFDPFTTQSQTAVIQDATPENDGIMTKEQAAKLEGLTPGGGGFTTVFTTVAITAEFGQIINADATGGPFSVTLPLASSAPAGNTALVVKNIGTANNVGIILQGGDTSDGPASLGPGQVSYLISDGVSVWTDVTPVSSTTVFVNPPLSGDGSSGAPISLVSPVFADPPLTGDGSAGSHLALPLATFANDGAMSAADQAFLDSMAGFQFSGFDIIALNAVSGSFGNGATKVGLTGSDVQITGNLAPFNPDVNELGRQASYWDTSYVNRYATKSSVIPSANTISMNFGVSHISGSVPIQTIHPAPTGFVGPIQLICDSGVSFLTGGNIAAAVTVPAGGVVTATFDGTLWYITPPASGAGSSRQIFFDAVAWAQRINQVGTNGNFTTGALFWFDSNATITGARWWHPATYTQSVSVKLWDNDANLLLASQVVAAPVPHAINTATFSPAFSYTFAQGFHRLAITVYDGVHQILFNGGASNGTPAINPPGMQWGPGIWLVSYGQQGGDSANLNTNVGYSGIEPTFTVP